MLKVVEKSKQAFLGSMLLEGIGKGVLEGAGKTVLERLSKFDRSGGIDNIISGIKGQMSEQAAKRLAEEHGIGNIYNQHKLLKGLNIDSGAYKNIIGGLKETEKMPFELKKLTMENQKLENELAKQNTIGGRLGRSNFGQIAAPVLGGALLTGGAMAMNEVGNTLSTLQIHNPVIESKMKSNLPKMMQIKPELRSVPKDLLIKYYRLIYKLAPNIASDETTAANILWSLYNTGGSDAAITELLSRAQRSAYRDPLQTTINTIGMGHKLFS